jgi:hypothetical protein
MTYTRSCSWQDAERRGEPNEKKINATTMVRYKSGRPNAKFTAKPVRGEGATVTHLEDIDGELEEASMEMQDDAIAGTQQEEAVQPEDLEEQAPEPTTRNDSFPSDPGADDDGDLGADDGDDRRTGEKSELDGTSGDDAEDSEDSDDEELSEDSNSDYEQVISSDDEQRMKEHTKKNKVRHMSVEKERQALCKYNICTVKESHY